MTSQIWPGHGCFSPESLQSLPPLLWAPGLVMLYLLLVCPLLGPESDAQRDIWLWFGNSVFRKYLGLDSFLRNFAGAEVWKQPKKTFSAITSLTVYFFHRFLAFSGGMRIVTAAVCSSHFWCPRDLDSQNLTPRHSHCTDGHRYYSIPCCCLSFSHALSVFQTHFATTTIFQCPS